MELKNVQQGKLGNLIYIPAASKLDEHTKLSGPSALRDLLNDILKGLITTSPAYAALTDQFRKFSEDFKSESTEDQRSLAGLETEISTGMKEWGAAFEIEINSVSEADLVKNLVGYKILDQGLNDRLDAAQFGQGFQRHLIFLLIQTAAKYKAVIPVAKKKDFQPNFTLLIFEEPEAFLHPTQQDVSLPEPARDWKLRGTSGIHFIPFSQFCISSNGQYLFSNTYRQRNL